MTERGGQASPATLRDYFQQQDRLADVGGPRYLAELAASAIGVIDAVAFGQAVHDLHLRRSLISIGGEVVNEAYDSDLDLTAAGRIEKAEHRLFELATTGAEQTGFRPFVRTLESAIDMAESAFRREGSLTGVTAGFKDLDGKLGGLQRSDLVVLAGRPGMGKTALATNIAFNAARASVRERDDFGDVHEIDGYAVAFFSLEMSAEQLALRILGEQAKVSSDEVRRGRISQIPVRRGSPGQPRTGKPEALYRRHAGDQRLPASHPRPAPAAQPRPAGPDRGGLYPAHAARRGPAAGKPRAGSLGNHPRPQGRWPRNWTCRSSPSPSSPARWSRGRTSARTLRTCANPAPLSRMPMW